MSRKLVAVIVSAAAALFSPLGVFLSSGPITAAAAGPIAHLTFSPSPIAPAGTLAANQQLTVTLTVTDSGMTPLDAAPVYLSFTGSGGATATVFGASSALTPTPSTYYTTPQGQVNITYKLGSNPPHTGQDTLVAQDDPNNPVVSASDTYVYNSITGISISKPLGTPPVTVTVQPARTQTVFLNLVHNGAGPAGTASVNGTALTGTFQPFTNDYGAGPLTITYTAAPVSTGDDIVTAQDFATNPIHSDSSSHSYGGGPPPVISSLVFSPSPIAKAGSLGNSGTATFTVTASSPLGPAASAPFTLCFTGTHRGSAMAGAVTVPSCTPSPGTNVTADANGQVSITYTAGGTGTTGLDDISASSAGPPAASADDFYNYDPVASYHLDGTDGGDQNNIASPTSMNDSSKTVQSRTVTIKAVDGKGGAGNPVAHTTVYVSFTATNGGGTANVGSSSGAALTAVPMAFETATDGTILPIVYTAPKSVPTGGQDVILITSDAAPTKGTVIQRAVYDFALTDLYRFSPTPIASTGTITAGAPPIVVRVTAYNDRVAGTPAPQTGATVYLNFIAGSSATASVGGTKLTSTPQTFVTDVNGNVTITYIPPATLPGGGADVINAVDATKNPAAVASDSYRFPAPGDYTFSPAPIAATGSLPPGGSVALTLNAPPFPGALYLSLTSTAFFNGAAPSAVATCNTSSTTAASVMLTSAPQKCVPDTSGHIPITYTAASPLPGGGSDAITAQNQAGGASVVVVDSYTYATQQGYWLVASDGGIFPFGPAAFGFGSTGGMHLNQPIVGMASAPGGSGYWLVASDGGIFPFGRAGGFGSTGNIHLNQPIVGMASTPDGGGYWLVASDGGIFPFGNAGGFGSTGSIHLNQPIVGMASTPDGKGYWLVASDGGIFPFGNAGGFGSTGNIHLNQPIVGMASTPDGKGYWLVASDGGIFPFGTAPGKGSTGNVRLNKPMVGMATTATGAGYWLVASDGGIFPFGDAAGLGSTGGIHLNQPIVGMAASR